MSFTDVSRDITGLGPLGGRIIKRRPRARRRPVIARVAGAFRLPRISPRDHWIV